MKNLKKCGIFSLLLALLVMTVSCNAGSEHAGGETEEYTGPYYEIVARSIEKESNSGLEHFYTEASAMLTEEELHAYLEENPITSDSVTHTELLPVYGKHLEPTSLVLVLAWNGDTLLAVKTLHVTAEQGVVVIEEFEDMLPPRPHALAYLNDAAVKEDVVSAYSRVEKEDVELVGVIYYADRWGNSSMVQPLGFLHGEEDIQRSWWGRWEEIPQIPSFSTVEEGRAHYDDFFAHKSNFLAEAPFYVWENEEIRLVDITHSKELYMFRHRTLPADPDFADLYNNHANAFFTYPLLNEKGEEGVYTLHFMFDGNTLLGEIILRSVGNLVYECAYMRLAEKNEEGIYVGLTDTNYVAQCKRLFEKIPATAKVKGVGYDGENFSVIFDRE